MEKKEGEFDNREGHSTQANGNGKLKASNGNGKITQAFNNTEEEKVDYTEP